MLKNFPSEKINITKNALFFSFVSSNSSQFYFNPNMPKGGQIDPPMWFFEKCIFYREGETLVFCDFYIILKHIFPENFIEFPQFVQKIWRNSLSILAIFINFHQFFGFFDIALLQRN